MSYKAKPRFTKPAQIIISEERRELLPLYNALLAKSGIRLERLRAAVDAGKAVQS